MELTCDYLTGPTCLKRLGSEARCEAAVKVTGRLRGCTLGRQIGKTWQKQRPEMESKTRMRSQSVNENKKEALRQ